MSGTRRAYAAVALAAVLFGASFPLSKLLLAEMRPLGLAGLLYLAAGLGLGTMRLLFGKRAEAALRRGDLGWLAGAVVAGGMAGPVLLLLGMSRTPAHVGALLANTETLFTVLLALLFFGDFLTRREVAAAATVVAGAALVGLGGAGGEGAARWEGPLLLLGAGLAWGLDNNFTQRLSGRDPLEVAAVKGIAAGAISLSLAFATGTAPAPAPRTALLCAAVGVGCYGLSIALFVAGLRHLGAARTSALFAVSPGIAVALSWAILGEVPAWLTAAGALLMIAGAWILVRSEHGHRHVHGPAEHEHRHVHDEHHRHDHRGGEGPEPHSHPHRHEPLEHEHPHAADLHHRHGHGSQ
ncbi:MAG: DMT family transporter [Planctomycetes bacterium]|nr:DMT family transporter [Planctomycetota bacterium]